jgi:hypothetical protein
MYSGNQDGGMEVVFIVFNIADRKMKYLRSKLG